MILDKFIEIKWSCKNKQHYINKGYVFTRINDDFKINVSDLMKGCDVKIHVKCDVCGNEKLLSYVFYKINTKDNSTYYSCSNKCSMKKNNKTNLERYGIEYPQKLNICKDKTKQTCLKRYGVESVTQNEIVKNKIKQTCLKRYGVESVQKLEFVVKKKKQTNLKNCGFECNLLSEKTKNKIKNTNLKKYGVEYVGQYKGHEEKRNNTNLKKYGFKYPLQNEKIKEKLINTTIGRYGEIWFKRVPSYNSNSIIYLDIISEKLGIKIQHALNGGEKKFIKYWVDGYIPEYNICIEWDEQPHKYNKNNDIIRENFLKEKFNCYIIRINENEFMLDINNQIDIIVNKIKCLIKNFLK
jgi:hypothetical protein